MEEVVRSENLNAAYRWVFANQGAPGVDGMMVHELDDHIRQNWEKIEGWLWADKYRPKPVLKFEIEKQETPPTWPHGGRGESERGQRARPLVECRGQPHEPCVPKSWFDRQGLISLNAQHRLLFDSPWTAGYGTVGPVV